YQQIMTIIEDMILNDTYLPDSIVISTTQISKIYSVNPTTAVKAVSMLVEKEVLYKKRGIGMAVTSNAKEIILAERQNLFFNHQLEEFISSAEKIGISRKRLSELILTTNFERSTKND
ncbi:GntR family transcriptional regulator, partial [Clostridioides difficile]|uniref:GntR family transcriptional regulator n=1 Tax=Clostridioides difficile TaxID=1496 RepID=UPI003F8D1380